MSVTTSRRWYSLDEASEYTGLAPRTLRDYIARGQLTAYRVGKRRIRFDIKDLDALFQPVTTYKAGGAG